MNFLLRFLFLIFLVGVSISARAEEFTGTVTRVADGDTVTLLVENGDKIKIRLVGIDAPEKDQPHGLVSKSYLEEIIEGKQINARCEKKDRYKRWLCKIFFGGADMNLRQVELGNAWWYRAYAKDQSIADRVVYAEAESNARNNKLGLWAGASPVPPWDWRRLQKRK
jgi:endonuclease YncB( thermonuclease family)